jgi:hypothetical protein
MWGDTECCGEFIWVIDRAFTRGEMATITAGSVKFRFD